MIRCVHAWFATPVTSRARRKKAATCYCHHCHRFCSAIFLTHNFKIYRTLSWNLRSATRLHSCLQCIYFACWGPHMREHIKSAGHRLWVELEQGNVYCASCQDYVHDNELHAISVQHQSQAHKELGLGTKFVTWTPSEKEISLLRAHPRRLGFAKNSTIGLRGLLNLGNTCFMSCIVQVSLKKNNAFMMYKN